MVDGTGVHVAHCCEMHGCKYGSAKCPVYDGGLPQEYPCPRCLGPSEARVAVARAQSEYEWTMRLAARLGREDWTSEYW